MTQLHSTQTGWLLVLLLTLLMELKHIFHLDIRERASDGTAALQMAGEV